MINIDDSVSNEAGREFTVRGRYFSLNFTCPPHLPPPLALIHFGLLSMHLASGSLQKRTPQKLPREL